MTGGGGCIGSQMRINLIMQLWEYEIVEKNGDFTFFYSGRVNGTGLQENG